MKQYFGKTPEESGVTPDGWFCTGDLGFRDEHGYYITGRLKDVVIVNGKNYYPQDVELAISSMPGVYEGHAVAVRHPGAERLLVLCEAQHGASHAKLVERIEDEVRDALGILAVQVQLCAPRSLPRTTSGKFQRGRARELWAAGNLVAAKSA
jgi:acyl-CoA synthetase (AMP-forming)/AMP-acid ligase II